MPDMDAAATVSLNEHNDHEPLSAVGLERRLLIALGGGVLLGASWIGSMLGVDEGISQFPAFVGAIVLVIPLLMGAWRELAIGRPSGDALATLAVLAAMSSENYLAAGFLALFLWMANLILSRTAWGAQRAIRDLVRLTPMNRKFDWSTFNSATLFECCLAKTCRSMARCIRANPALTKHH
jgi:cation transport ATPase